MMIDTPNNIIHLEEWEDIGTWEHISGRDWFTLRLSPYFHKNWKSSDSTRPYPIIETCLRRGLSEKKTLTVVKLWHRKHGHAFDEAEFWRIYCRVGDRAQPHILKWEANQYWAEIRRIQFDKTARAHSKMRVAYYLLNTRSATARQIADDAGMPIKTVRNALATLQDAAKVQQVSLGLYQAVSSFLWNQAHIVTSEQGSYVWDDEHPAMYDLGVCPNQRHRTAMRCWNYTQDTSVTVASEGYSPETEWVIDGAGNVVANGAGVDLRLHETHGSTPNVSVDVDSIGVA